MKIKNHLSYQAALLAAIVSLSTSCITVQPTSTNQGDQICGNDVIEGNEFCDDGDYNGLYGYCNSSCTGLGPHCGDSNIESGIEVCDDGDLNGTYGHCNSRCGGIGRHCGDGTTDHPFEECDDGELNGTYGHCLQDCSAMGPHCGDGEIQAEHETCDDGELNGTPGYCNRTCTGMTDDDLCGNDRIDDDEFCDDGDLNGTYGHCNEDCTALGPHCGDEIIQAEHETCDDGELNGTAGHCNATCTGMTDEDLCGNDRIDDGELCDDGELNGTYGHCNEDCTAMGPHCGDEIIQAEHETCDDGELNGTAGHCNATCTGMTDDDPPNGFEACAPGVGTGGHDWAEAGDSDYGHYVAYYWLDDLSLPTQQILVESWLDWGGPSAPGTYPITTDDESLTDCGLCILVSTTSAHYMPVAGSGSVIIDAITYGPGSLGSLFKGSFDIELQEVDIAPNGLTSPVSDGCRGRLFLSFEATVETNRHIPIYGHCDQDNSCMAGLDCLWYDWSDDETEYDGFCTLDCNETPECPPDPSGVGTAACAVSFADHEEDYCALICLDNPGPGDPVCPGSTFCLVLDEDMGTGVCVGGEVEDPSDSFLLCAPDFGSEEGDVWTDTGTGEFGEYLTHHWWNDWEAATERIVIQTWANWDGPSSPGTYPISVLDESWDQCGLCILISAGTAHYMPVAGSGSVTIQEITLGVGSTGSTFKGHFDIELQQVNISSTGATTPVVDGCRGRLRYSFDSTVEGYRQVPIYEHCDQDNWCLADLECFLYDLNEELGEYDGFCTRECAVSTECPSHDSGTGSADCFLSYADYDEIYCALECVQPAGTSDPTCPASMSCLVVDAVSGAGFCIEGQGTEPSDSFQTCAPGMGVGGVSATWSKDDWLEYVWLDTYPDPTQEIYLTTIEGWGGPTSSGTYPITTAETSFETCGLCIIVTVGETNYMPVAGSGSVVFSEVSVGNHAPGNFFIGSFDLELREVSINWDPPYDTVTVPGGCRGRLTHTWNEEILAVD